MLVEVVAVIVIGIVVDVEEEVVVSATTSLVEVFSIPLSLLVLPPKKPFLEPLRFNIVRKSFAFVMIVMMMRMVTFLEYYYKWNDVLGGLLLGLHMYSTTLAASFHFDHERNERRKMMLVDKKPLSQSFTPKRQASNTTAYEQMTFSSSGIVIKSIEA